MKVPFAAWLPDIASHKRAGESVWPAPGRDLRNAERMWQERTTPESEHFEVSIACAWQALGAHGISPSASHHGESTRGETEEVRRPLRTWSTTIASLGDGRYRLRLPLVVQLDDYGDEIIASWPEVEAWGGGDTESQAINALKDALVDLCQELLGAAEETLGKLPRRWAMALRAMVDG